MLSFGTVPPLSFEKFLSLCRELIPEAEHKLLKDLPVPEVGSYHRPAAQTLKRWFDYDRQLRNELVKIRSSRKHLDPAKYLRGDEYADPQISRFAISALRNPSILEGERMQDQERWHILDELSFGHYFDIDFLVIYCLKLLILQKWQRINQADPSRTLEEKVS